MTSTQLLRYKSVDDDTSTLVIRFKSDFSRSTLLLDTVPDQHWRSTGKCVVAIVLHHFPNDFLSNQAQEFKFVDDYSVIVTGKDSSELSALQKTCSDIVKWCVDWKT